MPSRFQRRGRPVGTYAFKTKLPSPMLQTVNKINSTTVDDYSDFVKL